MFRTGGKVPCHFLKSSTFILFSLVDKKNSDICILHFVFIAYLKKFQPVRMLLSDYSRVDKTLIITKKRSPTKTSINHYFEKLINVMKIKCLQINFSHKIFFILQHIIIYFQVFLKERQEKVSPCTIVTKAKKIQLT